MNRVGLLLVLSGICVNLWVVLIETDTVLTASDSLFVFLLLMPWLMLLAILLKQRNSLGILIASIGMMLFEIFAYYSTFINPQGSTAALVYAIKPFYQACILVLAMVIGYVYKRIRTKSLS